MVNIYSLLYFGAGLGCVLCMLCLLFEEGVILGLMQYLLGPILALAFLGRIIQFVSDR